VFLEELGLTGSETLHALTATTQSATPSDLPIIGDQSADVAASASVTGLPQWVEYQREATRATEAPWRIDAADVERHAHLKTLNESRSTSFGIWAVLVAALGVAVYWNYEELRSFVGNWVSNADLLIAGIVQNGGPDAFEATSKVAEVEAPPMGTKSHETAELQQTPPVARPVAATSTSGHAAPEKTVAVAAAETFAFSATVVTVPEARASASVRIERRGGTSGESSIAWWTSDGSALASDDYADLGTLVEKFAAGEEHRLISIPIVGDAESEGRESFYVHLATREEGENLDQAAQQIEVFVIDDD
jgi:hypothetical protein